MNPPADREAFVRHLLDWSEDSGRIFPWRDDVSAFHLLVAEVLLQRTFAEKVVPVYEELLERVPEPVDLANVDVDEIQVLLKPLGLQNRKAAALKKIGEQITEMGGVPDSERELLRLPFVGRYGANAVLCFGFGERRPIVDPNVVRVYNRVLSAEFSSDQDEAAWEVATEMLPQEGYEKYNLGLLDLGAEICTSQNPSCEVCPVNTYCDYYSETGRS